MKIGKFTISGHYSMCYGLYFFYLLLLRERDVNKHVLTHTHTHTYQNKENHWCNEGPDEVFPLGEPTPA